MNEAEIITRNEIMLKQIVSVYMRKVSASNRGGMIDREDMMQEITLCFLQEVRKHGEEIAVKNKLTLYHALYQAAIAALPVKTAYHAYARERRQALVVMEWDEEYRAASKVNDAFSAAAFRETLEGLEEQERQIIRLKLEGLTQREIGLKMGLSNAAICRRMKRIRRQFEQVQ